jgi:uncharacterized pyridoxamine 5'-phosphate oxidase family protein
MKNLKVIKEVGSLDDYDFDNGVWGLRLYILEFIDGCVKVGVTHNANQRFVTIQNSSGRTIKNIAFSEYHCGAYGVEYIIKIHYSKYQLQGEFFSCTFTQMVEYSESLEFIHNDDDEYLHQHVEEPRFDHIEDFYEDKEKCLADKIYLIGENSEYNKLIKCNIVSYQIDLMQKYLTKRRISGEIQNENDKMINERSLEFLCYLRKFIYKDYQLKLEDNK